MLACNLFGIVVMYRFLGRLRFMLFYAGDVETFMLPSQEGGKFLIPFLILAGLIVLSVILLSTKLDFVEKWENVIIGPLGVVSVLACGVFGISHMSSISAAKQSWHEEVSVILDERVSANELGRVRLSQLVEDGEKTEIEVSGADGVYYTLTVDGYAVTLSESEDSVTRLDEALRLYDMLTQEERKSFRARM